MIIVYARTSSDRQEEAGTIQSQLDFILHSSVGAQGVAETYADDGISGYSLPLWKRPQGKRLLEDAEAGKWKGYTLLVYNIKRLGRRAREIEEAIDKLLAYGVVVVSVRDGYRFDNQTAMGKFTRQLFASLAELDRNTIVETMRDGMVRKARHGQLLPTYARPGYDWNALDSEGRKAKGAHLVVNEKEAELVRLIFDKYPSMKTNHRLVLWLNGQGYRLPCKSVKLRKLYGRNERMFDSKALGDIIRNELYTGTISWGKKTNMQGQMPEEFRHHFPELQIVSFEVFNRCQAVMMERRKVPSKSQGSPYMFSGLVRCPICRGKTVGKRQWHSDYNYQETRRYKCRSYHIKGPTACKGWACDEQTIRKAVVPFLVDLLENRLKVMDSLEEAARLEQKQYAGDRGQALQAEIANAGRVIVKAQEGYEAEVYTAEQARARIYGARERIEKAERQLRDMEAVSEVKEEIAQATSNLDMPLADYLDGLPAEDMTGLCRSVFEWFSVRAWGYGWRRQARVTDYQLSPALEAALVGHIVSHATASETMWTALLGQVRSRSEGKG